MNIPVLLIIGVALLFLFVWWNRASPTNTHGEPHGEPNGEPHGAGPQHKPANPEAAAQDAPAALAASPDIIPAHTTSAPIAPLLEESVAQVQPAAANTTSAVEPSGPPTPPLAAPETEATAAPAPAVERPAPPTPDDFTAIGGIGPKINSVLHAAGILTFDQLALLKPNAIKQIITAGGVRIGDPGAWPQQAKLAARGQRQKLKASQGKPQGGRRV